MKISEYRAQKAAGVADDLTEQQRKQIRGLVNSVRQMHGHITALQNTYRASELCGKCENVCCRETIIDCFDEIDYFVMFFEQTNEIRQRIMRFLKVGGVEGKCAFHSPDGCIIPDDSRPPICKAYFCDKSVELKTMLNQTVRFPLYERYLLLSKELKEYGFNLGCNHIGRYNSG